MFYFLRGYASIIDQSSAVVDCSGVGYLVSCSSFTVGKIIKNGDNEITLYTYLAVREDALEIFGFADKSELEAFKLLIGVSGIGPKAALSILSTLTPDKLSFAIASANAKAISSAPGIGAKTSARVILELKDKMTPSSLGDGVEIPEILTPDNSYTGAVKDVSDLLAGLGYTKGEISSALSKIERSDNVETMLKSALNYLRR